MTSVEFQAKFKVGDIVASGGPRSKLRIKEIADFYVVVVPIYSKHQLPMRLHYSQLAAVVNGFAQVDPKRIEPTIQHVLIEAGLKRENTTENYLYGFAREWLNRSIEPETMLAEEIPPSFSVWEGARTTITINAYERKQAARRACIAHWGTSCQVCDMSFAHVYGIGIGFIHVHHLKPLGEIGEAYKLDPIRDLRPVCANCHAMLHTHIPAIELEQLRAIFQKKAAARG